MIRPLLLCALFLISCRLSPNDSDTAAKIFLGQGSMAGEVTDHSVILQTRLTRSDSLIKGELPGAAGWVKFQYGEQLNPGRITRWLKASAEHDHIAKVRIDGLTPNTRYQYQVIFGADTLQSKTGAIQSFRTLPGAQLAAPVSFAVVTGMNYYHFHFGKYEGAKRYQGPDRQLGYPALETIRNLKPDYFIGTGDNVYFDHPAQKAFDRAKANGKAPLPGWFDGKEVTDEAGMRRKYHLQFGQPRFKALFRDIATYWEKDDHDYRVNDSDPYMDFPISHELGIKNFREQVPIVDPLDPTAPTYRNYRVSQDLEIWLLEGRDYRSPNKMPDGPEKTIWGDRQKEWLKSTLLESTASFKLLISPTPMVGPDDAYKTDNHVNPEGFRHEGDAFFGWLKDHDFLDKNLYFVCGDRHWQYHAVHPSGFEEFSTGALVDNNSRAGRMAGDPKSTDPEAKIRQLYIQGTPEQASGGFLMISSDREGAVPQLRFTFYDENGQILYQHLKEANIVN